MESRESIELNLMFRWSNSLFDILTQLNGLGTEYETYKFNLIFENAKFIKSDGLLLFTSFVNELRALKKEVIVNFSPTEVFNTINYASRINFFKNINVEFRESFVRHPNSGRFIEINHIPQDSYGLPHELNVMIQKEFGLNESKSETIITLFYEFIANVSLHSKSANGGYLFFQKYPATNQIDIIIVDSGRGILESLKEAYPEIDNRTALQNCLQLGVTSGNGRGRGLFIASELAVQNNGAFKIVSGGNIRIKDGFYDRIYNYPMWNGTFLKWTFNVGLDLDIDLILDRINSEIA